MNTPEGSESEAVIVSRKVKSVAMSLWIDSMSALGLCQAS
jgi:hypothetical protein